MTADLALLFERGYQVAAHRGPGTLDALVDSLGQAGFRVVRDVVIGDGTAQLSPHLGDFWFHTDGVFLPVPPRWVIIQVLRAEGGGGLHVVDATPLAGEVDGREVRFGTERHSITTPVVSALDGLACIRYRADYMRPVHERDGGALEAVHTRVSELAARSAIALGELAVEECLVTDNWRILHRREAFTGTRNIRRIWLAAEASSPPGGPT
ncbi:MAG: TauD/TfdA family dioxygenase [Myxococcaceae bacterium]|nr:TauD/TfdA family dioxygenase [Myxococcaceae bacterium]